MTKVCHFINSLALGGAEKVVVELIRNESRSNINHTVCYIGGSDARRPEFEEISTTVSFEGTRLVDLRFLPKAVGFFRENDFDILHLHLPMARVWGRLLGQLTSAGIVSTYHNPHSSYHPLIRYADNLTRPMEDRSVAVSQSVKNSFDKHSDTEKKWKTIPNGIDVERFNLEVESCDVVPDEIHGDENYVFLNIGRCSKQKQQRDLLRSMDELDDELSNSKLLIVGDGPLSNDLERKVERMGLGNDVILTGAVDSVTEYYAVADVYVSASLYEGLPITLIEAAAAGLPTVATDVSGNRDIVVDGKTGYLAPVNRPSELSDRIAELVSGRDMQQFGQNAYERALERFDLDLMVDNYHEVYNEINYE